MAPKKNSTTLQKSIFIGLIALGLVFISLAVIPDLLNSGKKGFGYTQLFFLRNGILFFITGLVLSLFPRTLNYFKQTFSDDEYVEERLQRRRKLSFTKYDFITLLLFLIAANCFAIYFIGKENTIYDWDAAHFWGKFIEITRTFKASPISAIKTVLGSLQQGEYNYLLPFLLVPFSLLFGTERLPFILSIVNIFGSLSALSFLFLYKRFSGIMHDYKSHYSVSLIPLLTFFTFPFLWTPILFGYVALGGFSVMCLILFLCFKFPLSGQRYITLMIIGILLSVLVLFRRWYSFWSISFIITLMINEMIFLYLDYGFDRKRFIVLAKKTLFILLTSGIFYIMIAGPRFLEVATNDYTPLIAAYNSYTLLGHFTSFINRFGLFYIALTLSGLFVSIYHKNTRKLASFLIIQWIITFVLFTRISMFAFHHYYLLQPTILLFMSLFITEIFLKLKSKTTKIVTCSLYFLVSIVIFVAVFFPGASSYAKQAKGLFPRLTYYPMVREDIDEIKRMLNALGSILLDHNDSVYVLAGSELLNSEHFQKASLSLKGIPPVDRYFFRTHDLDLRDGFPSDLFNAKYVIVTDPVQCDLGCKKQRVISIAAESILKGENMGSSYERLPYEFTLQRGVKAYIYKRNVSPVTADIKFLSNALRKYYPDSPNVYETE
jgi:hypothetical protein